MFVPHVPPLVLHGSNLVRRLAKSVRIELKLAVYQIASQNIHLGSDLSRAFAHPGTNHRHVPQGTRIDALQQGSRFPDPLLQLLVFHPAAHMNR
jgi:hypothetical protein